MGTITVNVDDETEQLFREAVKRRFGTKKGSLGKAFDEALTMWTQQQRHAAKDVMMLMEKGLYELDKGYVFDREEIHER